MKKYLVVFFCCFLFPINILLSQSTHPRENRLGLCVSFFPQYVFIETFRTDIDKQIGKGPHWGQLNILVSQMSNNEFWNFNFDLLASYGGGLAYRYYFFSKDSPKWLYLQTGIVYKHSTVTYSQEGWLLTEFNGNAAYTMGEGQFKDKMYQYGADLKVGAVLKVSRDVFFDFYVGVGIRESEIMSDGLVVQDYDNEILSPAYSGYLPTIGVRVGINF